MQPVYAKEYTGEWVNYELGTRRERAYVQPSNKFYRAGGNAIVLGNGPSRLRLPLARLNSSNRNKRLESYNIIYGCNACHTEAGDLDWIILTHKHMGVDIAKDKHAMVYTKPEVQRRFKNMNLLPINHNMDAGASAAMLAAFHGASKVFLYGFDGQTSIGYNNNIYAGSKHYAAVNESINDQQWHLNLRDVIAAYPNTIFYRIDFMPPNARSMHVLKNHKIITFNEFVSFADI